MPSTNSCTVHVRACVCSLSHVCARTCARRCLRLVVRACARLVGRVDVGPGRDEQQHGLCMVRTAYEWGTVLQWGRGAGEDGQSDGWKGCGGE